MNALDIFVIILVGTSMITLAISHYFHFYRTNKVAKLRRLVLDLSCAYWDKQIENHNIFDGFTQYNELPPFNKMVYSFRPIKLKNYLSEKTLKELEPYF